MTIPYYPRDKHFVFLTNEIYNGCEKRGYMLPKKRYSQLEKDFDWPDIRYKDPLRGYGKWHMSPLEYPKTKELRHSSVSAQIVFVLRCPQEEKQPRNIPLA
ncbi:hypothetical protein TcCL_NonESM03824 [Trypanosoma cruzi]|nr:hypothetical protein TcCL_NonESM03824 [Trypanosoma cruzi]